LEKIKFQLLTLAIASLFLFAGCGGGGGTGSGGGQKVCTDVPGGAGIPEIFFNNVPPKGSSDKVTGGVRHVNVATNQYQVAIYIHVYIPELGLNGWWTKPTWASPTTPISTCDGTWENSYASGGSDAQADQIAAFLIPKNYSPPPAYGDRNIPGDIERVALAKVFRNR
jgi:hypothetical protein